jgi:hypothetical protein
VAQRACFLAAGLSHMAHLLLLPACGRGMLS